MWQMVQEIFSIYIKVIKHIYLSLYSSMLTFKYMPPSNSSLPTESLIKNIAHYFQGARQ